MRLLELQLLAGRRLPHHRDLVAQQVLPQCAQTVVAGGRHRCSAHVGIVTPREVAVGPRLVGGRHVLAAGWIEGRRNAVGQVPAAGIRAVVGDQLLPLIVAPDRRRPVVAVEALRARDADAGVPRAGHLLRRRLPVVHGDGLLRLAVVAVAAQQNHLVRVEVGVGVERDQLVSSTADVVDRRHVVVTRDSVRRRQVGRAAERTKEHDRDRDRNGPSEEALQEVSLTLSSRRWVGLSVR